MIAFLFVLAFVPGFAQTNHLYKIASPDKQTVFELTNVAGIPRYRVSFQDKTVMDGSALGIAINDSVAHEKTSVAVLENHAIQETIPWTFGEDDSIKNQYNETLFSFAENALHYRLEVRVFNGSVAFRYLQKGESIGHFRKELTEFSFAKPVTIYQYNQESVFTPALTDTLHKTCDFPATLTDGKLYLSIGEAANDFFTKAELQTRRKSTLGVAHTHDSTVEADNEKLTPWRTISIATSAIGLHAFSSLGYRLNPPPVAAINASLKPGKLIRSALNTQAGMDCIDFANTHHYQYIMFDAGWYGAEFRTTSDPTKTIAAIDMQKVIAYGKSKGIGVILYVNYVGLKAKLDEILPLYKSWGVAGMKFGFVDGLSQDGVRWLAEAIRKVNDYDFILNIHDNYKPTGLSRTYPSLLTQEGIRGDENSPDAFHTTTLPFTRFLAGAADFTFCFPNPKSSFSKNIQVSKAQQLVLPVIYYSPLQSMLWYGKPDDYTNTDEIAFYDSVPTVWNESVYLAGSIGKNSCVARRNGDCWYVGCITGFDDWKADIAADFLPAGKTFEATIYEDGEDNNIAKRVIRIKKGDAINIRLKAKGGMAMMMHPVQ